MWSVIVSVSSRTSRLLSRYNRLVYFILSLFISNTHFFSAIHTLKKKLLWCFSASFFSFWITYSQALTRASDTSTAIWASALAKSVEADANWLCDWLSSSRAALTSKLLTGTASSAKSCTRFGNKDMWLVVLSCKDTGYKHTWRIFIDGNSSTGYKVLFGTAILLENSDNTWHQYSQGWDVGGQDAKAATEWRNIHLLHCCLVVQHLKKKTKGKHVKSCIQFYFCNLLPVSGRQKWGTSRSRQQTHETAAQRKNGST